MKLAILAAIAFGCGGRASSPTVPPAAAAGPPATRWVPASPSYVFASQTFGEGQRGVRDAIELIGNLAGYDLRDVTQVVTSLLAVDALHADPLAAIGVDLQGSWAVFSEDINPTAVIHLAAPDQMIAFLDRQRERGLVTQSVIVDGTEVFSATLIGGVKIGWAIAGDWMWVHFALPFAHDGDASWFTASHAPHDAGWAGDWAWARRALIDSAAGAASGLVGYLGHGTIARLIGAMPHAIACAKLFEPIERAALSLEGDEHHFAARIALEVGSTQALRGMVLPPPSGWADASAHAAISAQWNLDAVAARSWLAQHHPSCLGVAGELPARLDETGVRTARVALLGFDPGAMSGRGAVALDLATPAYFERQLDRIPLRRAVERARTFGGHRGATLAIPFSVSVDYVLEPALAIAALGDGVLDRVVAPGPATAPPIFALELEPPALSAAAWEAVLTFVSEQQLSGAASSATRRFVEHLLHWRDGHLAVAVEPTALVVTVSGHRR